MEKKHIGIAFEGATLEEAYSKASNAYDCSITDLESSIIQVPSKGVFGFFKKTAIIEVFSCNKQKRKKEEFSNKKIHIKDITEDLYEEHQDISDLSNDKIATNLQVPKIDQIPPIFDDFYHTTFNNTNDNFIMEIENKINKLFSMLPYDLEPITVQILDEETISITLKGNDSALLIGKEGYRYKAISYILFNWINNKYGKMIRLEIAEFLTNQEENMKKYLNPIFDIIEQDGFYKTKVFDGILIHIALKQLRERFPNKYVAVKNNSRGEKYILINEYRK